MTQYRKKPDVVDAIQFTGVNYNDIADFCAPRLVCYGDPFTLHIPTLESEMIAERGDWIIKDMQDEICIYKPYIFDLTYEKVM